MDLSSLHGSLTYTMLSVAIIAAAFLVALPLIGKPSTSRKKFISQTKGKGKMKYL